MDESTRKLRRVLTRRGYSLKVLLLGLLQEAGMKRFTAAVVAAVAAAVLTAPAGAQKTAGSDALFEAARQKESVEGDLAGAIKQYQAIIASHKNDRVVIATALIRMAECYRSSATASRERFTSGSCGTTRTKRKL
jgi:hypothetical protein